MASQRLFAKTFLMGASYLRLFELIPQILSRNFTEFRQVQSIWNHLKAIKILVPGQQTDGHYTIVSTYLFRYLHTFFKRF